MKRILISIICLMLLTVGLVGCKAEPVSVNPSTPEKVVYGLDESAIVSQFATSTWHTTMETVGFAKAKKAFIKGGYTEVNASMVSGKQKKMEVLRSGDTLVTLYENDEGIQAVWDVCDPDIVSLLSPNGITGKGEVTMAQIGVERGSATDNPGIGMCYIYKLSDGRAVILDGGLYSNADIIYAALQRMDIAKDGSGRYRIAAWILSHGHVDHYGAFVRFAETYRLKSSLSYILYSFPIDENVLPSGDCHVPSFVNTVEEYYPRAVHVTPHAGLKYHFGNLTISVLYTPERLSDIDYTNDTSLIFIAECNGAKVLQTGDAGERAAEVTWREYEEKTFEADVVQITHHGLYTSAYNTFHWKYLGYIYNATKATYGLLPMGTRSPNASRNGRYTVINEWALYGYQTAFLIDTRDTETNSVWYGAIEYENFVEAVAASRAEYKTLYGYDGKNTLISSNGMVTYIMSTETENAATVFTLSKEGVKVVANELLKEWLILS